MPTDLKQTIVDAFTNLALAPDTDQATATQAYKKLALRHHPDRNPDDSSSTERFKQIGAAWSTLLQYYEHQASSQACNDPSDSSENDLNFFMYMFQETMCGHNFNPRQQRDPKRSSRPAFRALHISQGIFVVPVVDEEEDVLSPHHNIDAPSSSPGDDIHSQSSSKSPSESISKLDSVKAARQEEIEEYLARRRELELELEEEKGGKTRLAHASSQANKAFTTANRRAFEAVRNNDIAQLKQVCEEHNIDVNAPDMSIKGNKKKQASKTTLLHLAARSSTIDILQYLLDKAADTTLENSLGRTPFHLAVLSGNAPAVRLFIGRPEEHAKGCHPSKVFADGLTPLQLAIRSKSEDVVSILVKYATVHDVARLWTTESMSEGIREILRSKNGFTPSAIVMDENGKLLSKKALKRLEEKKLDEERAKQRREEEERSVMDLQKKLEEKETREAEEAVKDFEQKEAEKRKKREKKEAKEKWRVRQEEQMWQELEKKKREEAARLEQERRAEAQRQAEAARCLDEAKRTEQAKQLKRKEAREKKQRKREAALAEQKRVEQEKERHHAEEEQKRQELEKKKRELATRLEQERRAEEQKRAEEAKRLDKAKRAEEAKRVKEARRVEKVRRKEEARRALEVKRVAEEEAQFQESHRYTEKDLLERVRDLDERERKLQEREERLLLQERLNTEMQPPYQQHREPLPEQPKGGEEQSIADGSKVSSSSGGSQNDTKTRRARKGQQAPRSAEMPPGPSPSLSELLMEDIQTCPTADVLFTPEPVADPISSLNISSDDKSIVNTPPERRTVWRGRGRGRGHGRGRRRGYGWNRGGGCREEEVIQSS